MPFFGPPAPITSSPPSGPTDRWSSGVAYGDSAWTTAKEYLDDISTTDYELSEQPQDREDIPATGLDGITAVRPLFSGVDTIAYEDAEFTSGPPEYDEPDTIPAANIPGPNYGSSGVNVPGAPTTAFPKFTTAQPPIEDPDIPTSPMDGIDWPTIPKISDYDIPAAPEYRDPQFEGTEPTLDLTPPDLSFNWDETPYDSDLKRKLSETLYDNVVEGGTGLDEDTEQAIYDRATSRQETDNERMYTEAQNFFESRGFMLPPGALAGQLIEVSHRINQTREDLNNDILVQQSKLAQENTHFMIDKSIVWENQLMVYTNQYQQRAFEAAKFVLESAVLIYQAKIEGYKAQLEAYKALAQVYEARIRAEIARAELYKARIDGIKAALDVEIAAVEAYKAQVAGIATMIEAYKAEMQAAQIEADIMALKITAFRDLTTAYKNRVDAVAAEYQAYSYEVQGEAVKAEAFKTLVQAYEAEVSAHKARSDVDIARAQVQTEVLRAKVDEYKAKIDKYRADVDAANAKVQAEVAIEELDTKVYEQEVKEYLGALDVKLKYYAAKVEDMGNYYDYHKAIYDTAAKVVIAQKENQAATSTSAAKAAAQIAAAQVSTVSNSSNISYRQARSDSTAYNISNAARESDARTDHVGVYTYIHKTAE